MRFTSRFDRLLRRATSLAVVLAGLGAAAPAAHAGKYHIWGCHTPSGESIGADGWALDFGTVGLWNDCGSGKLTSLTEGNLQVGGGWGTPAASVSASWNAGPGLAPVSGVVWRYASTTDDVAPNTYAQEQLAPLGQLTTGGGFPIGGEVVSHGHFAGTGTTPISPGNRLDLGAINQRGLNAINNPAVSISGSCQYWDPANPTFCAFSYIIYAYDFIVDDVRFPVPGRLTGTLVDDAGALSQARTVSGTVTLGAPGTDEGSGIYRARLLIDGKQVATGVVPTSSAAPYCSPDTASDGGLAFRTRKPCPTSAAPALVWDSANVSDGTHDAKVVLEDASGNGTTAGAGQIFVRNARAGSPTSAPSSTGGGGASEQPAIGPGSPLADRGAENGAAAGATLPDAGTITLSWPTKKRARRPALQLSARWSAKATRTLSGRLTAASGTPIAGAQLRVSERGAWTGAAAAAATPVTTKPDGTFTAPVGLAAGSRTVLVQWFSHANDTLPAALAQATLTVRAATSIDAPGRLARGSSGRFTGRLRGAAGLLRAVPVSIQALDHGTWKTVAAATTGTRGKWAASVKFPRRVGRWTFRARVGLSATYPYAPGVASGTVTVRTS